MNDSSSGETKRLPAITLTAAASGREVNLGSIGVPTVLVFHGQDTADAALQVNRSVRGRHPGADAVVVASVIDLRAFPRMFRNMVEPALEQAYHNAAGKVAPDADPADLVVLLPDWDGAVHDAVGVEGSTRQAAIVVADGGGRIVCIAQQEGLAEAALDALAGLTAT
jgi:hypothetical protein